MKGILQHRERLWTIQIKQTRKKRSFYFYFVYVVKKFCIANIQFTLFEYLFASTPLVRFPAEFVSGCSSIGNGLPSAHRLRQNKIELQNWNNFQRWLSLGKIISTLTQSVTILFPCWRSLRASHFCVQLLERVRLFSMGEICLPGFQPLIQNELNKHGTKAYIDAMWLILNVSAQSESTQIIYMQNFIFSGQS